MMAGGGRNPAPPWIELPDDVTVNILHRLGPIEIIESAQKVCTTWRRVCQDPSMWRVIDMENPGNLHEMPYSIETMCRHAVDRSQGQLVDINIEYFGTNELMNYISHRSSHLRRLRLAYSYSIIGAYVSEAIKPFPDLEELSLILRRRSLAHSYDISGACLSEAVKRFPELEELSLIFMKNVLPKDIETIGKLCPLLKSFTLVENACRDQWTDELELVDGADDDPHAHALAPAPVGAADGADDNAHALAVAKSMPNLRLLALVANNMKNEGLQAILDGCRRLESLDIRKCFGVDLKGALGKRCSKQIKHLRLPSDCIEDVGWLTGFAPPPEEYHNWPEYFGYDPGR